MPRLKGKNAVITGGANGIGEAIVRAYVREGASVFFTSRADHEASENLKKELSESGGTVDYLVANNENWATLESLVNQSQDFLGKVDIVVNNAATMTRSLFLDIKKEEYETIMDVNLRFPFFCIQSFAKHMIENGTKGSMINVSSVSSSRAVSKMAHYQSSKAGLSMLTKSAAYELAEYGIRVNTISPGLTATKANRNQWQDDPELWGTRSEGIPLGRPGVADDHAGAAVFLASDESAWMTGGDLVVDGGWAAI